MNEIDRMKQRYAHQIEDGKRIEAFTSLPEWQWFVNHVIEPTCAEYMTRIMTGEIATDKEDWIMRGMVMGMKLVIETPDSFLKDAAEAKPKLKNLQDYLNASE